MRTLVALLVLSGCATGGSSPGPVTEFSVGKLLLHLHDNEKTLECVADPALYLRTLRPRLEEQEEALKAYLQAKNPPPESCLPSCVCDEWLDANAQISQAVFRGKKLRDLQDYARNQPLALCIKDAAKNFCGSPLEKVLSREKEDFRAPSP